MSWTNRKSSHENRGGCGGKQKHYRVPNSDITSDNNLDMIFRNYRFILLYRRRPGSKIFLVHREIIIYAQILCDFAQIFGSYIFAQIFGDFVRVLMGFSYILFTSPQDTISITMFMSLYVRFLL